MTPESLSLWKCLHVSLGPTVVEVYHPHKVLHLDTLYPLSPGPLGTGNPRPVSSLEFGLRSFLVGLYTRV